MSLLLHALPLGAAWVQWSDERCRQDVVQALATDSSHLVVLGPGTAGKTSLAFQMAVTMATEGRRVTFVRPRELSRLPLPVHGLPDPLPAALHLVKLWYPEQTSEVMTWLGHMHTQAVLPDVIIVDDFDVFVMQSKGGERAAARLYASLVDAAAWIQSKSGQCRVVLTASHRVASLPSISRHFRFNVVTLSGSCDGGGQCQLSCTTPTYNIAVNYCVRHNIIMLQSVDSKLPATATAACSS